MRKTLWLAAVLALLLSLTACSGGRDACRRFYILFV